MTRAIETAAPEQPWADLERLARAALDGNGFDQTLQRRMDMAAELAPATVLALITAARASAVGMSEANAQKDPAVVGELALWLERATSQIAIWRSVNGDMVGALQDLEDGCRAALAKYATQQGHQSGKADQ